MSAKNVHKPVALGEKQRRGSLFNGSSRPVMETWEDTGGALGQRSHCSLEGNSRALAKKMELHRVPWSTGVFRHPHISYLSLTFFQGNVPRTNLVALVEPDPPPHQISTSTMHLVGLSKNSFVIPDPQDIKVYSK